MFRDLQILSQLVDDILFFFLQHTIGQRDVHGTSEGGQFQIVGQTLDGGFHQSPCPIFLQDFEKLVKEFVECRG